MSDFTQRHEHELADYFGSVLRGRMFPSSGGMYEQLAAAAASEFRSVAVDEHGWALPVVPCRPTRSSPSSEATEASADALAAVRVESRVRAALARLEPVHVRVLAAWYVPRPLWNPHGLHTLAELRAVVALLEGEELARETLRMAAADARTVESRAAKALVRTWKSRARLAVDRAKSAYAEASMRVAQDEREERAMRFARGLG
jgi:hypothetical protein